MINDVSADLPSWRSPLPSVLLLRLSCTPVRSLHVSQHDILTVFRLFQVGQEPQRFAFETQSVE